MTARVVMLGYDPAVGEDVTCEVVAQRDADGSLRIVSVRTWEARHRPGVKTAAKAIFYDLIMRGWKCPACSVFNGEEKEQLDVCRACPAPRPFTKRL